ncbi:hypothetical protein [Spirochaeta cellobiosiphila]|uniref:hypothetical protein n=1 Tax=Spirochaeta cellobiosiphila TaxID=504483 RepID=UPI00146C46B3|nr:hypothetical protein [Spirochaeta cellobiosiphila]
MEAPKCLLCRYYYVTYDIRFPRGCRKFGIKSYHLPSLEIYRANKAHCPSFTPKK